jgi:hypothetical protein
LLLLAPNFRPTALLTNDVLLYVRLFFADENAPLQSSLYNGGHMPEWVKILITAIVSFSAAVLLDWVNDWRARRRTIRIVADEINTLALQMSIFRSIRNGAHSPNNPLTQKPPFDTERYDYAYEKDRTVLYQLSSWGSLKRFYDEVRKAKQANSLTDDEVMRLTMEFALLADRIKDGILGRQMKAILINSKFSHLPKVAAQHKPSQQ